MISPSKLRKTLKLQQDQADCGVACLLSVIQHYKGSETLERLRELSGTSTKGTTMLGLYQAANEVGFIAEAFKADISNLKTFENPCILHVLIDNILQHYVVFYGFRGSNVVIGDPAKGIIELSSDDLDKIWKTKTILKLLPRDNFELKSRSERKKWIWFWQLIKEDVDILSITMGIGLLATVLGLATAIFSQKLIDNILPSGERLKLVTSLILLSLLLLTRTVLSYIRQHFLLLQSKGFNNRIISSFFNALVYLPKTFFDSRKVGDLITRMNDTSRIQKNIAYITGSVFIDILILFTTSFFLINYSLKIAAITFCFIPIIFIYVLTYTKSVKKSQKEVMAATALNESNYIDSINGIIAIKQSGKEAIFTKKISKVYDDLQTKIIVLGNLANRFSVTSDLLGVILIITLIIVSSLMVLDKQLKIGEMMAIISLAGTLLPAVARLSQINLQLQEAQVAFDRMYDFTSITPEYEKKDQINRMVFKNLLVKNIAFRFPGRTKLLNDISFEIKKGEMIALLGESGCGKSTIIAILQKFYSLEEGTIHINNIPLNAIYTPTLRDIIGVVPQEIKLFNGTLLDNIFIGNATSDEALSIINFCQTHGFDQYFKKLPDGYYTLVGEEGINLSGGQKQLLALARALYRNPQILLLDEATASMDINVERFIIQMLKKMQFNMAIILISHKIQTAKIADRIYIVEKGEIAIHGSPKELLEFDNFFSQLVEESSWN